MPLARFAEEGRDVPLFLLAEEGRDVPLALLAEDGRDPAGRATPRLLPSLDELGLARLRAFPFLPDNGLATPRSLPSLALLGLARPLAADEGRVVPLPLVYVARLVPRRPASRNRALDAATAPLTEFLRPAA